MEQKNKELIVITGPTAVGKTEVVLQLAEEKKLEVISCDSRQFYREMNIGTAKPSPTELVRVPHHFVNALSIHDSYSAGDFEKDGLRVLGQCFRRNDQVILTGGSGLYITAICQGFNKFPEVPKSIIQELERKSLKELQEMLVVKDPDYYSRVDTQNDRRLVRALSIIKVSGRSFTSFVQQNLEQRPFSIKYIVLNRPREILYQRINERVDLMLEHGLLQEARELYPHKHLKSLQTVGYQELFQHFDGLISLEEAVRLIKRNSRRYAKRQLTWFRKLEGAVWQHPKEQIKI
ncbi:tRNA (adenosine(37)-N6)-dimethylallyltransferase MiaA [Portibacter marinus]|uniref:tRNA (adenosine(37)-N6)-dimethylallyltransferase MiaA n=1 Tax=Portibacter marinus TaxID=2898660 RepID=UPI001F020FA2|nr:tRNA (adenosine(37)-N6)-dimethylallyltransferase MiaA [Portibacter marinus]